MLKKWVLQLGMPVLNYGKANIITIYEVYDFIFSDAAYPSCISPNYQR